MLRYALVASFLFPSLALAQSSTTDLLAQTQPAEPANNDRWSLGIGVGVWDSPYAGEGTRTLPLPLVGYEGKRLFWRGRAGGVHLIDRGSFTLDAILSVRLDGFDIKDLGRSELLANGLDSDLVDDRDDGLDIGWRGRAGELKLEALADVTDNLTIAFVRSF